MRLNSVFVDIQTTASSKLGCKSWLTKSVSPSVFSVSLLEGAFAQFAPRETITETALLVRLAVHAALVQTRSIPAVLKVKGAALLANSLVTAYTGTPPQAPFSATPKSLQQTLYAAILKTASKATFPPRPCG